MDAITASEAISVASQTISLFKVLVDSVNGGKGKAEINSKVIGFQMAMMQLIDENHTQKEKIKELQLAPEIADKIEHHYNAYWMPADGGLDGPFLMDAWDREKKLVRLQCGHSFTESGVEHLVFFTKEPPHHVNIPIDFIEQHSHKAKEFMSICGQEPITVMPNLISKSRSNSGR